MAVGRTADIPHSSKVFCDLINQIYVLPIKDLWLLFNKSGSQYTLEATNFRFMATRRHCGIGVPQCALPRGNGDDATRYGQHAPELQLLRDGQHKQRLHC